MPLSCNVHRLRDDGFTIANAIHPIAWTKWFVSRCEKSIKHPAIALISRALFKKTNAEHGDDRRKRCK